MSKKIIDISYHQGLIIFGKLKEAGALVIIRVQYGSKMIDPRYKEYVAGCKKYNIPFAHYAYLEASAPDPRCFKARGARNFL